MSEKKINDISIRFCGIILTCNHDWDGEIWKSDDGLSESATCSKCGVISTHLDLMK